MTTAAQSIEGALRLIGKLGEGERPTAVMYADGLTALNEMIDAFSLSNLLIYATQDQTFTWPAATSSRTLGASGNFVGTAPISVLPQSHFVDPSNALTQPIAIIDEEDYQAIPLKTSTSTYPDRMWVNYTVPNVKMYVYPVPTIPLTLHLISVLQLTQPALIGTSLVIPAGYQRLFRYNLAVCLAAELQVEAPPTVKQIAASTMRAVKRRNKFDMRMGIPYPLDRPGRSDIYAGV